jgi:peptidyl-prolyl cis-trans isomerase SurA
MPPLNDLPELESSGGAKAKPPVALAAKKPDDAIAKPINLEPLPAAEPQAKSSNAEPPPAGAVQPAQSGSAAAGSAPNSPPVSTPTAPSTGPSLEPAPPLESTPGPAVKPAAPEGSPPPALPELPPLPGDPEKTTATSKPAAAGSLAAGIPLETAPVSGGASPAGGDSVLAGLAPPAPKRDPQVLLTSGTVSDRDAPRVKKNPNVKAAGYPVARVGDEIITQHDLIIAVKEAMARYPELRQQAAFDSLEVLEKRQVTAMLARQTLANMIRLSMLAQEAKRQIQKHDPKDLDRFMQESDRWWREEEIPQRKRLYKVETEQQLRERMAELGRPLDAVKKNFQQEFLAEGFLHAKLKDKLAVELPDLLKYYNEHVHLHEFDRPALITWREFVAETGNCKSRDEARQKVEQALQRLQAGEDFARLARAESHGPSSSRATGGLMQTSPGAYAVPAVNSALETLQVGQTSGILEGPESYHIVRLENRRPAGPATFEEVQDKIRPLIARQKEQDERAAFLAKLRQKTMIWTAFDGTPNDPRSLLP